MRYILYKILILLIVTFLANCASKTTTQIKKDSYKAGCEVETKILRSYGDTLRIEHAPNNSEEALMISQEYCAKRRKLSNINQSNCDGCCRTTYICKGNLTNEAEE